jgi:Na+-driven multidrug efflux pump
MIDLFVQAIASFLGGYFTEKVFQNTIGTSVFVLIIFLISICVCLLIPLFTGALTFKLLFWGIIISLIFSISLTGLIKLFYYLDRRKK